MTINPVSRIRLLGSAAIVITTFVAIFAAFFSIGPSGLVWAYIIGGVALTYAVVSMIIHIRYPQAADAAWDEQNTHAYRNSLIFGYWVVLWVFVVLLLLTIIERIDPAVAFYWLGPVLGIVPAMHYMASVLRGRAE